MYGIRSASIAGVLLMAGLVVAPTQAAGLSDWLKNVLKPFLKQ